MKAILAKKVGMTQIFDESGVLTPVTVLAAGPCVVTQIKSSETDGYEAVQIGFEKAKHLPKPQAGHLKKAGSESRYLREIESPQDEELKVGQAIEADVFEVGDKVVVTGTSKGKGFAGTIKRHNFHRGPKTHGSRNYRAPGSIGSMYPQHVFKGIKMAGRMGHDRVSVKNLKVVKVDGKNGLLAISGAIPGPKKSIIMVRGI